MFSYEKNKELFYKNKEDNNILNNYKNGTPIIKTIIPTDKKYFNNSNGFGIYYCVDVDDDEENRFTIKGSFISDLILGQTYEIDGKICTNTYNGYSEKQINVSKVKCIRPLNKKGIISYLQSLKGLKSKAENIYDKYQEKSIDMLIKDPLRVASEVKGIGKKTVLKWQEQLQSLEESQNTITKLLDYGLTIKQARKLYSQYNDSIIEEIEKNPYFLATSVKGYGFTSCDRIAKNMGYDLKSNFRLTEGIIYTLNEASFEGHCYLPLDILVNKAQEILDCKLTINEMREFSKSENEEEEYYIGLRKFKVNINKIKELLELHENEKDYKKKDQYRYTLLRIEECDIVLQFEDLKKKRIFIENKDDEIKIYLTNLYYDQLSVTYNILRLSEEERFTTYVDIEKELDIYCKREKINLEEKQKEAILEFSKYKSGFYVLNGSAGCGKTFTLKIILDMIRLQFRRINKQMKVKVFAPTGKASKVAAKATGLPCSTVHRGLKYNPIEGFEFNKTNPLDTDVLVIDESSMLDITLTRYLLEAVKSGTKVIFIGDIKQLPSVGPGNVLKDIIESEQVKIVTLNVVKRQDLLSDILRNANNIIEKKMIQNYNNTKDAFVIFKNTVFETQDYILKSIRRIQELKNYSLEDIQLLCPQKTSDIGTIAMNYIIQQEFNPENNDIVVLNKKFNLRVKYGMKEVSLFYKKKDKVIHMKNNYDMEWYIKDDNGVYVKDKETIGITNGETGVIEEIVRIKEPNGDSYLRIIVKYDDKYVFYNDVFDELEHAYALTIHKCITDDTWLFTNEGLKQLKDINNGASIGQFKKIDKEIEVYNGRYLEKPSAFYNAGKSMIRKFTTKRGYALSATYDHRMYVLNKEGYIEEKLAKDITNDDFLLINKKNNIYGDIINLPEYLQDQSSLDSRTKKYTRPTKLTKELARFLGFMVADGTIAHNSIRFSKRYLEVTEQFKNDVKKIFGYENSQVKLRKSNDYMYEVSSADIMDFCKKIDGLQPNNKHVPSIILSASKEHQCEFLKAVFEDGSVNINKNNNFDHIELSMKNEIMAEQIKMMLLNMGIICTKNIVNRKKDSYMYILYIYKEDSKLFANNIGFISNIKNENLKKCFKEGPKSSKDAIPYIPKLIKKMLYNNGLKPYRYKKLEWALYTNKITRDVLGYILKEINSELKNDKDYKHLEYLYEYFYIDSIKNIEEYEDFAYCLEMPETHNFIQNGIYARNCQGSQWKAVIIPILTQNFIMLDNNLLYTAYTRAEEFNVVIGQPKAINYAISNSKIITRYTGLKDKLAS